MRKTIIALAVLSSTLLGACKDDTQAKLAQQQKQIESLQQQLAQQQNGQSKDGTVYELSASSVNDTIPQQYQANGNNGQPVTGTDGQQYIYDHSTGKWLLQSLIGSAAGAFIGNALANKFSPARNQSSPIAKRARANYTQTAPYQGRSSQQLNTRSLPAHNTVQPTPQYRPTTRVIPNYRRPTMRGSFGRRR